MLDEVRCQCRQTIVLTSGPTTFDRHIAAFVDAGINQTLPEGSCQRRWRRQPLLQKPYHRERRLRTRG